MPKIATRNPALFLVLVVGWLVVFWEVGIFLGRMMLHLLLLVTGMPPEYTN